MAKHEKTPAGLVKKFEELRRRLDQIERDLDRVEDSCSRQSDTVSDAETTHDTVERANDPAKWAHVTELALEATGVIVLVVDVKGRIIHFNQGAEQITGFAPAEILGRSIWKTLVPQDESERVRLTFAELQAGQQHSQYESSILSRNGDCHWIAWSNTAIPDSSGMLQYIVSSGIEATTKTKHEAVQPKEVTRSEKENREIRARLELLSPRERDVLRLVVQGKPNKRIAGQLKISIKTVEHHRSNLMKKMRANSIAELVRMTILAGWL